MRVHITFTLLFSSLFFSYDLFVFYIKKIYFIFHFDFTHYKFLVFAFSTYYERANEKGIINKFTLTEDNKIKCKYHLRNSNRTIFKYLNQMQINMENSKSCARRIYLLQLAFFGNLHTQIQIAIYKYLFQT